MLKKGGGDGAKSPSIIDQTRVPTTVPRPSALRHFNYEHFYYLKRLFHNHYVDFEHKRKNIILLTFKLS